MSKEVTTKDRYKLITATGLKTRTDMERLIKSIGKEIIRRSGEMASDPNGIAGIEMKISVTPFAAVMLEWTTKIYVREEVDET